MLSCEHSSQDSSANEAVAIEAFARALRLGRTATPVPMIKGLCELFMDQSQYLDKIWNRPDNISKCTLMPSVSK